MRKRQEAAFTTAIKRRLLAELGTGAYELKHTRGKPKFYLRELKEHQKQALEAAESPVGIVYKIPDDGIADKPFDVLGLKLARSWVVIRFPDRVCAIRVKAIRKWKKPSIDALEATHMAEVTWHD